MSGLLQIKQLTKFYKKRKVVDDVFISIDQGEVVGLLGPNGAGKTTTFYMVVGLIKPSKGTILLNTRDITSLQMYERARMGIGYLPQESSIFRKLTVEENILAPLEYTPLSSRERQEKADSLLESFRIAHLRKSLGYNLSGGERRRTEIARALALNPKFLLLDEPFAGIDPIAVEDIQAIVRDLKSKNIGLLITDHNVHETLSIIDRAYLIFDGKILIEGTPDELSKNKHARNLYLGSSFSLDR